jgi:hypothetical protein
MTKTEYKEYEPSSSTYGSSYRSAASSGSGYSGGGWRNRDNYNWNCWTGSSNKKSSKKFKDYEDWYDDEDEDNFFDEEEEESYDGYEMKDSRKTYIGDGDSFRQGKVTWNEDGTMNIEIKDDVVYNTITSHYSWVMSKFTGKLTPDELEVISTQYLDINDNDNDLTFYNYLVDYINDDDL